LVRLFKHYVPQRLLLQILLDAGLILLVVIGVAVALAEKPGPDVSMATNHALSLAAGLFLINSASGFYQQNHGRSWLQSCLRALVAALIALPLPFLLFKTLPVGAYDEPLALAAMLAIAGVIVHRVYAAHADSGMRTRLLVVGSGVAAQQVAKSMKSAAPHVEIVGYFADANDQLRVPRAELLGTQASLTETARKLQVDEIVVALNERRGGGMPMKELLECRVNGIRVFDISALFEKTLGQIRVDYVNAGWLIFGDGFDQGPVRTTIKRVFDILCASTLIVLSAPLMLLTALLVALESPGPILYRQERVGRNGRCFNVIKFRSMYNDAEKDGKPRWAAAQDSRITWIGNIIRKLRIDELPQLFNVLAGTMSIVGPRPERPYFVEQLTAQIPYYGVRQSVKPGITGWAQVRYHYGSTVEDSQEKLQYDLYYVKNNTLFLDALILFETVAVVLTGKGAR
jgi:sugar transferase (PEP-CTERM system associated)